MGVKALTLLINGKLRERARCGELCVLIGYPSGQGGAILPAQDCPFCSCNKITPKSKQVHESFHSQNIFRDSKKIFFLFDVRVDKNVSCLSSLLCQLPRENVAKVPQCIMILSVLY